MFSHGDHDGSLLCDCRHGLRPGAYPRISANWAVCSARCRSRGVGFIIAGLVSMGMPGFSGFVAEFPIFMGAWQTQPIVAIIAILGVIVTAGYIFLVSTPGILWNHS